MLLYYFVYSYFFACCQFNKIMNDGYLKRNSYFKVITLLARLLVLPNFLRLLINVFLFIQNSEMPVSTTYTGGLGRYPGGYTSQVRRSLPNMAHTMLINEPAKIYPYHLLMITNYRLPADVDRCNLEVRFVFKFNLNLLRSQKNNFSINVWYRQELCALWSIH